MKIKEMKGKVKKFYEEHPGLCVGLVAGGLMAAGEIIGWKLCCNAYGLKKGRCMVIDDDFNRVLNHAMKQYETTGCSRFWTYNDLNEGFKISELGKLAEVCEAAGFEHMDQELTHIIALGKPITEK